MKYARDRERQWSLTEACEMPDDLYSAKKQNNFRSCVYRRQIRSDLIVPIAHKPIGIEKIIKKSFIIRDTLKRYESSLSKTITKIFESVSSKLARILSARFTLISSNNLLLHILVVCTFYVQAIILFTMFCLILLL